MVFSCCSKIFCKIFCKIFAFYRKVLYICSVIKMKRVSSTFQFKLQIK